MEKSKALEMIAAISNANGISGFEEEVVAEILPYAKTVGETSVDRMRNVFIRRIGNTGSRPVVQLDAHSDEVGFMVQAICPNGTLGACVSRVELRGGSYLTFLQGRDKS